MLVGDLWSTRKEETWARGRVAAGSMDLLIPDGGHFAGRILIKQINNP